MKLAIYTDIVPASPSLFEPEAEMSSAPPPDKSTAATAAYLSMPDERRAAAQAHAALLGETVRKVAKTLPLGADVDDFRRVLVSEVRK